MNTYSLPNLPYPYDALEPAIDRTTMEIHHQKHHQAYLNNLNTMLEKYPALVEQKLEEFLRTPPTSVVNKADLNFFKNNAGGFLNHNFFWTILGPQKEIDEKLRGEVENKFGSLTNFKIEFTKTAVSHFGSGWAWLVRDPQGELKIYSLPNQDTPYQNDDTPLLTLDLWEHAYYLKYQNRRAEYIENWWTILKLL
ncbi:MAG: superoxide dismutase [Patescibacteria group bacterium]